MEIFEHNSNFSILQHVTISFHRVHFRFLSFHRKTEVKLLSQEKSVEKKKNLSRVMTEHTDRYSDGNVQSAHIEEERNLLNLGQRVKRPSVTVLKCHHLFSSEM